MAIEQLNEIAVSWGRFIGAQVVDSTIVLLLVAAVWLAVRHWVPAQFGYCLFLLVLLKTVVPGQVAVPVQGIFTSAVQTPLSLASTPIPTDPLPVEGVGEMAHPSVVSVRSQHTSVSTSASNIAPRSARFVFSSLFPSLTVLMLLWAGLTLFLLGRLVYTEWHTRRLIKRSKPVHPDMIPISVDWLMQTARVRHRFSLYESAWAKSPLVCGLLSPVLVLPKGFFIRHSENQVCWILLHELAHLRRRDALVKLFQKLIQCLFFFHPAVWIANWTVDRQREFACDADAVTRSNLPRRDCGEGFLTAVLQANNARNHLSDPIGLSNSKFLVKERLMRILSCNNEYRTGLTFGMTSFLFVLTLCVMPFTGYTPLQAQESETPDFTFTGVTHGLNHSLGVICHVLPTIERFDEVRIVKWYGPHGEEHSRSLTGGKGYSLINGGRSIKITAPMDHEQERLVLIGKWKVPWSFRAVKSIEPGTTRMLLGDHIGQEGVDFRVNEALGIIQVLKAELCDSSKPIRVNYRLRDEEITPQSLHTMFRGDRGMYAEPVDYPGDESVLKQFMGMPQNRSFKGHDFANVNGTGAVPTDDPNVFILYSPVRSEDMQVCFLNPNKLGERFLWLTEGVDYLYDQEKGQITLISDKAEGQGHLYVQGETDPSIMNLNRSLEKPAIVTLNGRTLEEGVGFTVDYETGAVRVLDPAIHGEDVEFELTAGNHTYVHSTKPPEKRSRGFAEAEDYDASIDRNRSVGTNARPTVDPMVYNCLDLPFYSKGFLLGIGDRKKEPGDLRWLKRDQDYTYDEDTGLIAFLGEELPFDPDSGEWVFVSAIPRQDLFLFHKPLEKGSVSVTLNGEELTEGEEFSVDYETGAVRVLDPAINEKEAKYVVKGPGRQFVDVETQISRQPKRTGRRSRGFADAEDFDPEVDMNKCGGSNAIPTDDPTVFSTIRLMHTKGLIVAIAKMGGGGDLRWLKRDRDYTYDEEKGHITFLGEELPFDKEKNEYVFVYGTTQREIFDLEKPVTTGSVSVSVNGEELAEGISFTIDYEKGRLTILDPAIQNPAAKYRIVTLQTVYDERGSRPNPETTGIRRNPNTLNFSDCEDYDPTRNFRNSVGAGASPTDDPYLHTLSLQMKTKGLLMGVTKKDMYGVFKWLTRDRDYTHNEAEATITLLKDDLYDRETEHLFVSGIPEPRNVHLFHKPLELGSVRVTLEGRDLTENEGFTVDYAKGIVTLTDPLMSEGRWPECTIHVRGVGETEEQSSGMTSSSSISTYTKNTTKSGVTRYGTSGDE